MSGGASKESNAGEGGEGGEGGSAQIASAGKIWRHQCPLLSSSQLVLSRLLYVYIKEV